MSGRLTMICHASTSAVRAARFPIDEPLDSQGEALASELSCRFTRVDACWTGPALRTRQTAAALKLDALVDPALRDIDLGRWAGQSLAEVAAAEPDAVGAWTTEPDAAPHGGESVVDLLERIRPWLGEHARDERRIAVVTHAAVIRAAIILAIDAKPGSFWRIDVVPLCRVDLRAKSGVWALRSMNSPRDRIARRRTIDTRT